uniref:Uncharacterized protein n=1 Tax=Nelumbo nucifera TaxID=4432 RepID=A0A822XNZ4_NELNU|nr:TPA_asm: hypothetical protein HUJ06_022384 [Nelumbo nucifera]
MFMEDAQTSNQKQKRKQPSTPSLKKSRFSKTKIRNTTTGR